MDGLKSAFSQVGLAVTDEKGASGVWQSKEGPVDLLYIGLTIVVFAALGCW